MDRMTGAELRARRHRLGVQGPWMADRLGVRQDTYRRWESGRDPIPVRVRDEVAAVEDITDQWVETVREWIEDTGQSAPWDPLPHAQPDMVAQPQWWLQVVLRAIED
ncbi:helix-turn-helix domain-containing protein [Serinibacter salmoneus]|nr:helix-turn-helix transcriptional regulator [Serinibacter salmoneus]